eukprot:8741888-Ditylum_brightwellii.AAC.1
MCGAETTSLHNKDTEQQDHITRTYPYHHDNMSLQACTYPQCLGNLPAFILDHCGKEGCMNELHHICQTQFEFSSSNNLFGMKKWWYPCLMTE